MVFLICLTKLLAVWSSSVMNWPFIKIEKNVALTLHDFVTSGLRYLTAYPTKRWSFSDGRSGILMLNLSGDRLRKFDHSVRDLLNWREKQNCIILPSGCILWLKRNIPCMRIGALVHCTISTILIWVMLFYSQTISASLKLTYVHIFVFVKSPGVCYSVWFDKIQTFYCWPKLFCYSCL